MKKMKEYVLNINGFDIHATYSEERIRDIWKPLLTHIRKLHQEKKHRIIVFLAAPPAVGKSTLVAFLEMLSKEDNKEDIQCIGLDGFHYPQRYIATHSINRNGIQVPMKDVKGCPETFDIDSIKHKLACMRHEDVYWPIYDRNLHDVVPDQIHVHKNIVLIEGNWLLLKDEKWNALSTFCDYSIRISADPNVLKDRLIARKVRGGLSREEACVFYEKSEQINVMRALQDSKKADLCLRLTQDFDFEKEDSHE